MTSQYVDFRDLTPKQRMEALGWELQVDDDTMETQWFKLRPEKNGVSRVIAYQADEIFHRDLDKCRI